MKTLLTNNLNINMETSIREQLILMVSEKLNNTGAYYQIIAEFEEITGLEVDSDSTEFRDIEEFFVQSLYEASDF